MVAYTYDNAMPNQAISYFAGSTGQNILGTGLLEMPQVVLDNVSGFNVTAAILVSNEVGFNKGILNTQDFGGNLVFGAEAIATKFSDQSHVKGPLIKTGNTNFIFPIGDNGLLRSVGISAISDASAEFSVAYKAENSNTNYAHNQKESTILLIDTAEYWQIDRLQSTTAATISLSWNTAATAADIWDTTAGLRIVRWDIELGLWVDQGGVVNITEQNIETTIDKFGVFALAKGTVDSVDEDDFKIVNELVSTEHGLAFFKIDNITDFPQNNVDIFSRDGIMVFSVANYDNETRVFKGISNKGAVFGATESLPSAIYFYLISYIKEGQHKTQLGYLYVN